VARVLAGDIERAVVLLAVTSYHLDQPGSGQPVHGGLHRPVADSLPGVFLQPRRISPPRAVAGFHTGLSATADIEGVLIHGAQGVRSLS
jgi:hypothetical protein